MPGSRMDAEPGIIASAARVDGRTPALDGRAPWPQRRGMTRHVLLLALLCAALLPAPVRAETTGDLYAATATGIGEYDSRSGRLVNTIATGSAPVSMAFDAAGRILYLANGTPTVSKLNIASIAVAGTLRFPAPAARLAMAADERLVAVLTGEQALGIADFASGHVERSNLLPAEPAYLATSLDGRYAAAAGEHFVSVIDTSTGRVRNVTIASGTTVSGVAVDETALHVAFSAPKQVVRYALADLRPEASVSLAFAPTAIAAVSKGVMVAGGTMAATIISGRVSERWTAAAAVTELVGAVDGLSAYAREATAVERFTLSGSRTASIAVTASLIAPHAATAQAPGNGGSPGGGGGLPNTATAGPSGSHDPGGAATLLALLFAASVVTALTAGAAHSRRAQ